MVNRIVVGAHYGLRDWLAQRVTAVVMVLYTVVLFAGVASIERMSYESWRALFSGMFMRYATFVFVVALTYHVWVGVRDIVMDYVWYPAPRLAIHVVVILLLVAYLGWAVHILWRL
jgi:succinate dehydrogenase / fumarate reductase membrane anchor subunit